MSNQYIGRGEPSVELILSHLFGPQCEVVSQCPLHRIIIGPDEYEILGPEVKKHKFDFRVRRPNKADLIVEVNYKHGPKADHRWNHVFIPLIHQADMIPVVIEDNACKTLFKDKYHQIILGDWLDVLNALNTAGVEI